MQLVIRKNRVIAWHEDGQRIIHVYPPAEGFDIITRDVVPDKDPETDERPDPRSELEKATAPRSVDKWNREMEYPTPAECLLMLYHDRKNGTDTFVETIDRIHSKYPHA